MKYMAGYKVMPTDMPPSWLPLKYSIPLSINAGVDIRIPKIPITMVIQEIMDIGFFMMKRIALRIMSEKRMVHPRLSTLCLQRKISPVKSITVKMSKIFHRFRFILLSLYSFIDSKIYSTLRLISDFRFMNSDLAYYRNSKLNAMMPKKSKKFMSLAVYPFSISRLLNV